MIAHSEYRKVLTRSTFDLDSLDRRKNVPDNPPNLNFSHVSSVVFSASSASIARFLSFRGIQFPDSISTQNRWSSGQFSTHYLFFCDTSIMCESSCIKTILITLRIECHRLLRLASPAGSSSIHICAMVWHCNNYMHALFHGLPVSFFQWTRNTCIYDRIRAFRKI